MNDEVTWVTGQYTTKGTTSDASWEIGVRMDYEQEKIWHWYVSVSIMNATVHVDMNGFEHSEAEAKKVALRTMRVLTQAFTTKAIPRFQELVALPPDIAGNPHIIGGEFQSDKYPTCPRGLVPLSTKDPAAQDLLHIYAARRRAGTYGSKEADPSFADAVVWALDKHGYTKEGRTP